MMIVVMIKLNFGEVELHRAASPALLAPLQLQPAPALHHRHNPHHHDHHPHNHHHHGHHHHNHHYHNHLSHSASSSSNPASLQSPLAPVILPNKIVIIVI